MAAPGPALLLDAHLAHALAAALRRRGLDAVQVAVWHDGRYRQADDATLLRNAAAEGRLLLTYDTSTLPLTAYGFLADGTPFAGVLVLSSRIGQEDIGGQLAAVMAELADRPGRAWANAVVYARRQRP